MERGVVIDLSGDREDDGLTNQKKRKLEDLSHEERQQRRQVFQLSRCPCCVRYVMRPPRSRERNREHARRTRMRKKAQLATLQLRVAELQTEVPVCGASYENSVFMCVLPLKM